MKNLFRLLLLVSCLSFLGCGTGDLSPLPANSGMGKIVVKSQFNFIRNIGLSIKSLNSKEVDERYTQIVIPGKYSVGVLVADANVNPLGTTTNLTIDVQAGHTYLIAPYTPTAGGAISLTVEDKTPGGGSVTRMK